MKTKRAGIYVRVSTGEQNTAMQEQELRDYATRRHWTLRKVYADTVSGAIEKRPGLDALFADCRRGKLDCVVVWKFDRFARSLKQLLHALELFRELGIGFVSCTEAIDSLFHMGKCCSRSLVLLPVGTVTDCRKGEGRSAARPKPR